MKFECVSVKNSFLLLKLNQIWKREKNANSEKKKERKKMIIRDD